MFKNLFTKLLVTYLCIIICVITILSVILSIAYSNYAFNEKYSSLVTAGSRVNQLVNDYYKNKIQKDELTNSLNSIGYITDSSVQVLKYDKKTLENPKLLNLEEDIMMRDLSDILDGRLVFRKKQYSKNFKVDVVFTGVPLRVDSDIKGAILFLSPLTNVTSNIINIMKIIWSTALLVIFISAVIIYFCTLKISRPIKKMEYAARCLAMGENTEHIHINSRDEISSLAESFNFMKDQLIKTEKIRKEFIASVSHDLRTPLTSIKGFVQGMLDGLVKPEDSKKYLNIIKEETVRLIYLTGEILELAKIQSGNINIQKGVLDAKEIINSVIPSLSTLIEEKGIKVYINCADETKVYADNSRLKQILVNIIGNSIKYCNANGNIWIDIQKDLYNTRFNIRDDGTGIPKEDLPYIFEKFYRVDKSRQSSQGGSGLGLNIVKNLVDLHGGRISAISEINSGTEIIFEIPSIKI